MSVTQDQEQWPNIHYCARCGYQRKAHKMIPSISDGDSPEYLVCPTSMFKLDETRLPQVARKVGEG